MTGTPTLVTKLAALAAEAPDAPALHGGSPSTGFSTITWSEYDRDVRSVGKSLIALGVSPGEAVTIAGRNRPEWIISDLGVMAAGAVPTPIYATNTADQVAWLINHSEATVAIVDDEDQYEKLIAVRDQVPNLKKVVLMGDAPAATKDWVISWQQFLELGRTVSEDDLNFRINNAEADDLALLCYTSGTTGEPKGVKLTHANFAAVSDEIRELYGFRRLDERIVSYLPLCHVAEHVFTILNQIESGVEVYTCADLNEMKEYLPSVRPTLFLAVPRVWEKFEAALQARLGEATGVKSVLASWALATESSWFNAQLEAGRPITGVTRMLANKLVIDKVKSAIGLEDVRYCFSGAAPLSRSTSAFFASLGLPIHEVYGMTETTAIISIPAPGQTRPGKVGKAFSAAEVKIAADGEILIKGPNITRGYFKNEAQTEELLDAGGWLHSGDIGEFDQEGYLQITDRKKELFKTSGGKYIAPAPIEAKLKSIPAISQAVVVGESERFVGALVALDIDNVPALVKQLGLDEGLSPEETAAHPVVQTFLEEQVTDLVNVDLARFEQVKKIVVLPAEMTPESGELTPTLKLRRKVIAAAHDTEITGIFA